MTLPRKLTLRATADGVRLFQAPVDELQELADGKREISEKSQARIDSHTYQLQSTVDLGKASDAGWKILAKDGTYTLVGYDRQNHKVYVDRSHSGSKPVSEKFFSRMEAPLNLTGVLTLNLVVDRSSVELFANQGSVTMTDLVFPKSGPTTIQFYSTGGSTGAVSAHLTEFKSAH
jgi:sucrose-6-phosphate hydrolase SacC (GH32 family)